MKSQGLPINFIILITIAVVVLLAVMLFFTMGFRTEAVGIQTAINTCESRCLSEVRYVNANIATKQGYTNANSQFCGITQVVEGYGEAGVRCDILTGCEVVFRDSSRCMLECNQTKSECK